MSREGASSFDAASSLKMDPDDDWVYDDIGPIDSLDPLDVYPIEKEEGPTQPMASEGGESSSGRIRSASPALSSSSSQGRRKATSREEILGHEMRNQTLRTDLLQKKASLTEKKTQIFFYIRHGRFPMSVII
ncbi:hypothetical protein OSTOST_14842 [Ostertagia ostertagi]